MKTKAHVVYKLEDGTRVAGCTTIVGLLNKPALVHWANKIGLQGYDVNKYTDDLANVGTLTHEMVDAHFRNEEPDTDDYTKKEIDRAENAFISFLGWIKDKKIKPIIREKELISEKYKFGGTPDLYADIGGEKWLIDFKTGSGIYDDYLIQLAGYMLLLEGKEIDKVSIVRIGRTETEGFETKTISANKMVVFKKIFKHLLKIYQLKREVK